MQQIKSIAFHLNCLCQGGAERVVSTLANSFAEKGLKVYVTTEWRDEDEFVLDERVERVDVGLCAEDKNKNRAAKFMLRIRHLREFLKKEKPDVLVAFTHRPNYRALTAARGTGVPTVIAVRINPVGWYDHWDDKIQIPLLFPKAAGAVFQTKEQRDFFRPYLQDNSRIIINPVNQKYIDAVPPSYEGRAKLVVQSSRLVDFKNQPMLLRAFIKVHSKHPEYKLRIYGPDSKDGTKAKLEKIISDNSAQDYIELSGASMQLEKDMTGAQIFVLSSDYEGMPNVLMEAMAMGLPCVATDCPPGAPRELIKDGENGLLVPVGDETAMADAIDRYIENDELRKKCGTNARKIKDIAGTEVISDQWLEYLNEVVSRSAVKRAKS
ncbi:MAG: glycosyltransferase [Lachnospiraceae bacterium]